MKPPKVFLFDIFGVLCSSMNTRWVKEHPQVPPEAVRNIFREVDLGYKSQADFYSFASKSSGIPVENIKSDIENGLVLNQTLFDLVAELRKRYTVAVLSDSNASFVYPLFEKHGIVLNDCFDRVFISSETKLLKPTKEAFQYCLRALEVSPQECVFVDDSEENIRAAQTHGIQAYHFTDQAVFEAWVAENKF